MKNKLHISNPGKPYYCDVCGGAFKWNSGSSVFGSIGHSDIGARQFLVCSERCKKNSPDNSFIERIIGDFKNRKNGGIVVGAKWHEWDNRKEATND